MRSPRTLSGVSAADGLAVGRALRLARRGREASRPPPATLRDAIARVRRELDEVLATLPPDEAALFEPEAHILREIAPALLAREAKGESHEEAIFAETGCGCTDLVIDLRERLLAAVEGSPSVDGAAHVARGGDTFVLLADVVTPSTIAFLPRQVCGVVAALDVQDGPRRDAGRTSHAAILARGRGVPLVYVAPGELATMPDDGWVIVDAHERDARISVDTDEGTLAAARGRMESDRRRRVDAGRAPLDHLGVSLFVNVASAHDDIPASAEGVGLVRTELMFAGRPVAPTEDEQLAALLRIASKARGAPVVVRLFDAGEDKPLEWLGGLDASRGVARLLAHPDALRTQLRTIERARERADVRALLPFVRGADEVDAVRALLSRSIPLGAMVETPKAVDAIDAIARAADFVSVGTNDLTAASLGLPRSAALPLTHPRVLALVRRAIDGAHVAGRAVMMCGEVAGDEHGARIAVGLGADALSVAPSRADLVRAALARTSADACRAEAEGALAGSDARGLPAA